MTAAKLQTNPPEGSGLNHSLLDRIYTDLVMGKRIDAIPVVGLLVPVGHGERKTAKGTHRRVEFDFLRLEPVKDQSDAEQVAWQITRAYDLRHGPSSGQTELPLANSPEEKRSALREQLAEWASDNNVTEDELDQRFVEMLGGQEYAAAERVADASLVHLVEFVGYVTEPHGQGTIVPGVEFSGDGDEPEATEVP